MKSLVRIILIGMLVFLTSSIVQARVDYHAIIVGVADYKSPFIKDLNYPDDDARDIYNALLLYSNWQADNIQLLIDSAATKDAIKSAIDSMSGLVDSDDVCLFFFSGHGSNGKDVPPLDEADSADEYICPYDTSILSKKKHIRDDELADWLASLPTSNIVVMLDTCYSGGQIQVEDFTSKSLPDTPAGVVQKGDGFATDLIHRIRPGDFDDNEGCVVLTACEDDELSVELRTLQNGLFSYYVVKGLEENADKNGNGELSAEEIYAYVEPIVDKISDSRPKDKIEQHPMLYDDYPTGHPQDGELAVGIGKLSEIDSLIVSGVSHAPSTVTQGQTDVIMEQLDLTVQQGESADGKITIASLKLDRTGEGDDNDVSLVKLLESDRQTLIDSSAFTDGSITFQVNREVTVEKPDTFYISVDIASDAPVGNSVGVKMVGSSYITVKSPDTVSTEGFPIESGIAKIQAAGGWPSDPTVNVPICTAANGQYSPQLVSDGSGGAIITWEDWRGDNGDIYAQRVDASGAVLWTTDGILISTEARGEQTPDLVSDGQGGAIITWNGYHDDIYAQRVDASGTMLWTTDGVPICTAADCQMTPQLVSDGAGGAIITWWDWRCGNNDNDIYAQRVDASGAVLWETDGVLICMAAYFLFDDTELLSLTVPLVSDGSGGAIITWWDCRSDNGDIYTQRVDVSGAVLWTTDGVPICTVADGQGRPQLVSDGAGGAIITWEDWRSDNGDIYAQRVDASGSMLWTTDGIPICTAADNQGWPQLVSDGSGGAIITWWDCRSDNGDIYAQRVDASGAVLWTTDGVPICTVADGQGRPQLVSDGAGGVIITWGDGRSGSPGIYAQRVNSNGVALWATDGIPICTAARGSCWQQLVSDGAGGAIITWEDARNGNYDIYAQNVQEDGSLGGISGGGGALALAPKMFTKRETRFFRKNGFLTTKALQNYPNPFNPDTWIPYQLAVDAAVTIRIYNLKGQLIRTIALGNQKAGVYVTKEKAAYWDGRDDAGEKVGSGVYFYTLRAREFTATRKMAIMK